MPLFIFVSGYFSKSIVKNRVFRWGKVLYYLALYLILKICFYIESVYILGYTNIKFHIISESGLPWYLFAMAMWLIITRLVTRLINKGISFKYIFLICIVLGIMIGYLNFPTDVLCISRIVIFYPFFICGYYFSEELLIRFAKDRKLKFISILGLISISLIIIISEGKFYKVIRGLLTARNSYSMLGIGIEGGFYRIAIYVLSYIMCFGVLYIIPKTKNLFTSLGKRTIQVYLLHYLVLNIYIKLGINQYISKVCPGQWKAVYISIAIIMTLILSLNIFSPPVKKVKSILK